MVALSWQEGRSQERAWATDIQTIGEKEREVYEGKGYANEWYMRVGDMKMSGI